MMLYACATVLFLLSLHTTRNHVTAAPASWSEKSDADKPTEDRSTYLSLVQALINRLRDSRNKRTRADGGFFLATMP